MFYVLAFVFFFYSEKTYIHQYPSLEVTITVVSGLLALIGIILGVKSVNTKETVWIGRVDIIVGVFIILLALLFLTLGMSPA